MHVCRECNDDTYKLFSLVNTVWCPISLEILKRDWRLLCQPCYQTAMGEYQLELERRKNV